MPPFYLQFCTAKLHESKTCSKSCHPWHNFCAGMGLRYAIGLEPSTVASGGVLKGGHTMCPTGSTVRLL